MSTNDSIPTTTEPEVIPVNQLLTAKTTIHLGYDLIKRLKHHAIDNDMTFSSVVNVALHEYLDKRNGT